MSLLFIPGCIPLNRSEINEHDFDEIASRIVQAFEQDSMDPIENILSKSALETQDLKEGISYGNELLGDNTNTIIKYISKIESDDWDDGKHDKYFDCTYSVISGSKEFCLEFEFYSESESDPNNRGLYRVSFLTKEENDVQYAERQALLKSGNASSWNYGATYERAGIYNPEWQTTPPPDGDIRQNY